jgi:hypothetical protein
MTLVSVNEYLGTSYRPDREYIDGELVERNVGEWSHSCLQALLLKQLLNYEDQLGLLAVPGQRVQVKAARFRVPDLCVVQSLVARVAYGPWLSFGGSFGSENVEIKSADCQSEHRMPFCPTRLGCNNRE